MGAIEGGSLQPPRMHCILSIELVCLFPPSTKEELRFHTKFTHIRTFFHFFSNVACKVCLRLGITAHDILKEMPFFGFIHF